MAALHHLRDTHLHIIAQIIEAIFIVRAVSDVGGVSAFPAWPVRVVIIDTIHRQAEEVIDLAHPFCVAAGEIVVHRHNMHAPTRQRVQVGSKGGDERFPFTRAHLSNLATVQRDAPDQLHIIMALSQRALGGFTDRCKGFRQKIIQRLAAFQALLIFIRFELELIIRESFKLWLQRVNARHNRAEFFQFPVIFCAENLLGEAEHGLSLERLTRILGP